MNARSRWLAIASATAMALPLFAQQPAETPSRQDAAPKKEEAPAPLEPARKPAREFRPSEEVSPDQEVDFPADL